jgi:hypothetical protein
MSVEILLGDKLTNCILSTIDVLPADWNIVTLEFPLIVLPAL